MTNPDLKLTDRIQNLITYTNHEQRLIVEKTAIRIAFLIGFYISQEEKKRSKSFSNFWREISTELSSRQGSLSSRSKLFEARTLFYTFRRFCKIMNHQLHFKNVNFSSGLSKSHLVLIATHCKDNVEQQDIFIMQVKKYSLTTSQLKDRLKNQIPAKGDNNALLTIGRTTIKKSYDLSCLSIDPGWSENMIKAHVIRNISVFMKIVLGGDDWCFIPRKKFSIGGRKKFPDLVFYDLIDNRYLIIDLKCSHFSAELDRAKSQIFAYQVACNKSLDASIENKTIGLILGKNSSNHLSNNEYFMSTETPDLVFYSSFLIRKAD
jgi:predicted nuclease of restriction endonuclease-like (RecB) superfamily